MCGGTSCIESTRSKCSGLSPRVRGNPLSLERAPSIRRTIPACAGEPGHETFMPLITKDYPRVCGGTGHGLNARLRMLGLSPRVRGNLSAPEAGCISEWTIPACAGEPLDILVAVSFTSDYPRVCGGT